MIVHIGQACGNKIQVVMGPRYGEVVMGPRYGERVETISRIGVNYVYKKNNNTKAYKNGG